MSGQDKRKLLFDKYSGQLKSLVDLGLCDIELLHDKTFICPICFNQFSENDLDTSKENFLTLEDAPPKSLGGKANTLTCKKCNNEFGHEIDYHLTEKLKEIDIYNFHPNTGSKVFVEHNGIQVQGTIKVDENGNITITHANKTNNPTKLKEYVDKTKEGHKPFIKFPASRVDMKKFEVALLKLRI